MLPENTDPKEQIERDGFYLCRGLLTEAEIGELRRACQRYFRSNWTETSLGKFSGNAAGRIPELHWIFTHERILDMFRRLLGRQEIVFSGNSDIQHSRLSGWHKDDGDGQYFPTGSYEAEDCKVYRAGIYFQDHEKDGQGMRVRRGSHRRPGLGFGEEVYIPSRVGDVVFIDVRLSHAGLLPDLVERSIWQVSETLSMPALGRWAKGAYWLVRHRRPKMSLFFSYGLPNQYTDHFIHATMNCHAGQPRPQSVAPFPKELVSNLERHRILYPKLLA